MIINAYKLTLRKMSTEYGLTKMMIVLCHGLLLASFMMPFVELSEEHKWVNFIYLLGFVVVTIIAGILVVTYLEQLIFIMYDTLTNVSNPIYKNADKMKSLLINFEFTGIIVSVVLIVLMSYTSIILPISIVIWALTVLFNPLLWPDSKEQDENK